MRVFDQCSFGRCEHRLVYGRRRPDPQPYQIGRMESLVGCGDATGHLILWKRASAASTKRSGSCSCSLMLATGRPHGGSRRPGRRAMRVLYPRLARCGPDDLQQTQLDLMLGQPSMKNCKSAAADAGCCLLADFRRHQGSSPPPLGLRGIAIRWEIA